MPMDNEEVWGQRANNFSSSFTRHPFLWVAGLLIVLLVGGFIWRWASAGADIISPENVKQQYALAYQDYNALGATARNACVIRQALDTLTPGSTEYVQRQSQLLAVQNNYNRIAAQYAARMDNFFQAKQVKPDDLPFDAPSEAEMEASVC